MNHILKLQPSSRMFESLVNNVRSCGGKYYICGHCLRSHIILLNNGRNLSTYVSALKLMLKRKQSMKKIENGYLNKVKLTNKCIPNKKKVENRYTELVRVTRCKSKETKVTIQDLKASEVTAFAEEPGLTYGILKQNKTYYESTRTYDDTIIIPENTIEYVQNLISTNSINNPKSLKMKLGEKSYSTKSAVITSKNISNKTQPSNSTLVENYLNKLNLKSGSISQKLKINNLNEKKENVQKNVMKILPLTAVEIFPMPKRLQQNISRKSERAIKELTEPDVEKSENNLLKSQELPNLHIAPPMIKEEEKTEDADEYSISSRNFEKILINASPKEFEFKQLIQSYIDVAVNNKMIEEALNVFSSYRKKFFWKDLVAKTNYSSVYNTLLHSYSIKGDWETANLITNWMELDGVKFNCQTYAGIIDCLGRVDKNTFQGGGSAWKDEVVKNLGKLYSNNFTLNDLFTKTALTEDKQETILSTIRIILPEFEIEPTKTKLNSNCLLLKDLFKDSNTLQPQLGSDFVSETIEKLVEEQLLLEKNYSIPVKSVYQNSSINVSQETKKKCEALINEWRKMLKEGFILNLKTAELEYKKFSNKITLYVYLKSLPVETYVDVMLKTVQNLVEYSGGYSPSTALLHRTLGDEIYQRYKIKKKIDTGFTDTMEKLFKKYCAWYVYPSGPAMNTRQEWQMLIQDFQDGCQLDVSDIKWPNSVKISLGKYLYDLICKEIKINVGVTKDGNKRLIPAFYPMLRYKNCKSSEEIKCHPVVSNLFRKCGPDTLHFDANQVPMVCPPKPWKNINHGGYLILPTEYIRHPQEKCDKKTDLRKVPFEQLYSTFDSLNTLQAVPWTVNENLLDIILEVFRNGGSDKLSVPQLPDMNPIPKTVTPNMSLKERLEAYKKRMGIIQERQNQYGLWCEALYRLSLANHYRKRVFWFPQNFDFRGRVYPVPPHLNHLGSDLFRSLLLFAKSKPIGAKGLDWLKIHTINLTGTHKKKSIQERLNYANAILPDILDSAERPLTGDKWWTTSEEPWQTLAACMEIRNALSAPNPELYKSRFPIHQDGSCNGLQHYAALGRDKIGAKSVNLSPSGEPQDVYSVVTQIIEEGRSKDAAEGVEIAQILKGFIRRKVVKQTIMTTVYGVTRYGARLQIAGQLEDIEDFPKEYVWKAAGYLTNKTFQSLQQMFTSAKEIQDWFLQCAVIICKKKDYVQWISPLGLPILQPYAKMVNRDKRAEGKEISPNVMKQKNAFAPNFVHSLDSSHMMLTSLFCEQAGLTFASIHDCFWTHPSTVDTMNRICREQFVSLHSQPILQNLSQFFTECYANKKSETDSEALKIFKSVPKTGDFDLKSVLSSVYFFS